MFSLVKLTVLILVIGAVALYFSMSFVADYALKTITAGTPITAGVGTVYMNPFDQKLDVNNFYMSNPKGYKYEGNAIAFKQAYIDADFSPMQFFNDKVIHFDEVKIDGLRVVIVMKAGTINKSNLTDIISILEARAGLESQSAAKPKEQTVAASTAESKPIKLIIDKLIFRDCTIVSGYGADVVQIPMPSFELTNLGENQGGLTPTQLSVKIIEELTKRATLGLAKEGLNLGIKEASGAVDAGSKETTEAVKSIGNALKSIF